jgi:hypothetical protein
MLVPRSPETICNLALARSGASDRVANLATDNTRVSESCQTSYDENRRTLIMEHRPLWAIKRQLLAPYSGLAWSAAGTYGLTDLVLYGANVYRCILAVNPASPTTPDLDQGHWAQVTRDGYGYACPLPPDCLDPLQAWEAPTVSSTGVPRAFAGSPDPEDAFNLRNPLSRDRQPFALENANDGTDDLVLLTDIDTPVLKYIADVTNPNAYPSPFVQALAWIVAADLALDLKTDQPRSEHCQKMGAYWLGKAFIIDQRDQQQDSEPMSEFEASRRGLS